VKAVADVRQEKKSREAERKERQADITREQHIQQIATALANSPEGETKRKLRDLTGLNDRNFASAVQEMILRGCLETCEVTRTGVLRDAYRMKNPPKNEDGSTRVNAGHETGHTNPVG
jgi:hypothetical protein